MRCEKFTCHHIEKKVETDFLPRLALQRSQYSWNVQLTLGCVHIFPTMLSVLSRSITADCHRARASTVSCPPIWPVHAWSYSSSTPCNHPRINPEWTILYLFPTFFLIPAYAFSRCLTAGMRCISKHSVFHKSIAPTATAAARTQHRRHCSLADLGWAGTSVLPGTVLTWADTGGWWVPLFLSPLLPFPSAMPLCRVSFNASFNTAEACR